VKKTRSRREEELKAKQEEREEKELTTRRSREERPSQEDNSIRPPDLEFIQLFNPSLSFPLNYSLPSV
jgi:hypothetical protein